MLGAVIFGLVCVLLYWLYQQYESKPPVEQFVPQPFMLPILRQVGAVRRSVRYFFAKSPHPRTPLTLAERVFVLSRDKKTCQICGRKAPEVPLEIDHIIPVSKGGTNDASNLQALCFDCNRGK